MAKIPQLNSFCYFFSLRTGAICVAICAMILSCHTVIEANRDLQRLISLQRHPPEDVSRQEWEARQRTLVIMQVGVIVLSLVSAVRISLSAMLLFGIFFHLPYLVLYWCVFNSIYMVYGIVMVVISAIVNSVVNLLSLIYYPLYMYALLVVYSYYRVIKNPVNLADNP